MEARSCTGGARLAPGPEPCADRTAAGRASGLAARLFAAASLMLPTLPACRGGGGGAAIEIVNESGEVDLLLQTAAVLNLAHGSYLKIAPVPEGVPVNGRRYVLLAKTESARPVASIDVTDPASPTIAQELPIKGWVRDVAVRGSTAFVTAGGAGLGLVSLDVSDPTDMQVLGSVGLGDEGGLAVQGDYAFVGLLGAETWSSSLQVVDVSDPAQPVPVGTTAFTAPPPQAAAEPYLWVRGDRFVVEGGILYAANGKTGLDIVDVSNPFAPILLANVPPPASVPGGGPLERHSANDVYVTNQTAYVATCEGKLQIVDVSFPSAPVPIGVYEGDVADVHGVAGWGEHLSIVGYKKIAGKRYDYVKVLRIASPAVLEPVGEFVYPQSRPPRASPFDFSVPGPAAWNPGLLFVADNFFGLRVFDVGSLALPEAPTLLGSLFTFGEIRDGHPSGSHYFALYGPNNVLAVTDLSDPLAPAFVRYFETHTGDTANKDDLAGKGSVLYVAGNERTVLVDVSFPADPAILGELPVPGTGTKLKGSGDLLAVSYVEAEPGVLHVRLFDVAVPSAPVLRSDITLGSALRKLGGSMEIVGNDLYVHAEHSLYRIDVALPGLPEILGEFSTAGLAFGPVGFTTFANEFVVRGDHLYMARPPQVEGGQSNPADLAVLGISGFPSVQVHPYLSFPWPMQGHELQIVGGRLFLMDGPAGDGLLVFDLSEPHSPRLVARQDPESVPFHQAYDMDRVGSNLLVPEIDRIRVLPLPPELLP